MQKTRKELLVHHSLSPSDFYAIEDKVIIRRTGMDKLEKKYNLSITVESIQITPYGDKINATILGSGRLPSGAQARTIASASPDNCQWSFYPDMAYKRLKHKLLLMTLDLYELDVFSQEESDQFNPKDAKAEYKSIVDSVQKSVDKSKALNQ